ncbi:outer membrane lipoprotein-sorting protein [Acidobacteria bacterium AH-259-D05]|nr:outer membrane lipoprotein-sorting protein [Acidobacteria bacterium AH-259-D05]
MKRVIIIVWVLVLVGCGAVKKRTTMEIPPAYAQAQVASLDELVKLINERYAAAEALSVSRLKVEFTGGSIETGYMEEYRSAKGYLVAKWPDSVYVNILNPLTSSTVVAMATAGDTFQIWLPGENKYLTGKTDVELEEENPIFNVRPHHLLKGILVEPIPVNSLRYRYFLEETEDLRFKYYIVGVIDIEGDSRAASLVRKLWIERSTMRLVRQQYYETGELVSAITYGQPSEIDGVLINSDINIERKRENYRIGFELATEGIKVNPSIQEGAFEVPVPPGAELVVVVGKTTGN